jgi:hypothetical protein
MIFRSLVGRSSAVVKLDARGRHAASRDAFGAHFAEVEVDLEAPAG